MKNKKSKALQPESVALTPPILRQPKSFSKKQSIPRILIYLEQKFRRTETTASEMSVFGREVEIPEHFARELHVFWRKPFHASRSSGSKGLMKSCYLSKGFQNFLKFDQFSQSFISFAYFLTAENCLPKFLKLWFGKIAFVESSSVRHRMIGLISGECFESYTMAAGQNQTGNFLETMATLWFFSISKVVWVFTRALGFCPRFCLVFCKTLFVFILSMVNLKHLQKLSSPLLSIKVLR